MSSCILFVYLYTHDNSTIFYVKLLFTDAIVRVVYPFCNFYAASLCAYNYIAMYVFYC